MAITLFHFQRLRTDHSVLQKRNAYEQKQDGHDFKRQQGDSSVQRHREDFQWDNQDLQQRRDNGSYQHRHADYQRRPGHLHRSQNYPYRSWHHHSDQRSYEYANNSRIPPPNSHYHYPALVSNPGPIIPPPSQFCPLPNTAPERAHLDRDGTSTALRHPAVSSLPPVLYPIPQPINNATAGGRFPFPPDVTAPPAQTPSGQLNPIAVQLFNLMATQFMNQRNPVPVQA